MRLSLAQSSALQSPLPLRQSTMHWLPCCVFDSPGGCLAVCMNLASLAHFPSPAPLLMRADRLGAGAGGAKR